jgi:4-hydroxy-2-oxoheptanedioate aldolase
MSGLRANKVKENLVKGKIVAVPMGPMNPDLVEHFGPLGFDGIWFEGEHGPVDFNNVSDLTRACDLWGMTPIVRVYQNEPATIYRTLDLGALGICVPHVNTKSEAENVVNATKFAPIGMTGSFTN